MNEVITDLQFNFSNNGEAHQLTINSVKSKKVCDGDAPNEISGGIDDPPLCNIEKIDKLLNNFVVGEISTTETTSSTKIARKCIDKISLDLDTHLILVRGLTCGYGISGGFEGRIYAAVSLPDNLVEDSPGGDFVKPIEPLGYQVIKDEKIFTLGSTYSVVTREERNASTFIIDSETGAKVYGKKVNRFVFRNGAFIKQLSTTDNQAILNQNPPEPSEVSIKHGYTVGDFMKALKLVVDVEGDLGIEPKDELFEQSGTLRSCLSAIAEFYGQYWYIDLSSGSGKIKIMNSSVASEYEVPSLPTDSDCLSYSFTDGGRAPQYFGIFVGSDRREEYGDFNSSENEKLKRRNFGLININHFSTADIYEGSSVKVKDVFKTFYYFFLLRQTDGIEKIFDKFLLTSVLAGGPVSALGFQYDRQQALAKEWTGDTASTPPELKPANISEWNIDPSTCKYIAMANVEGKKMPLPSSIGTFDIFLKYFESIGCYFISNPIRSKAKANSMSFIAEDGCRVIGPFESNDNLSQIPDLQDLYLVINPGDPDASELKIKDLVAAAGKGGDEPVSGSQPDGEKYYFIAIKEPQAVSNDDATITSITNILNIVRDKTFMSNKYFLFEKTFFARDFFPLTTASEEAFAIYLQNLNISPGAAQNPKLTQLRLAYTRTDDKEPPSDSNSSDEDESWTFENKYFGIVNQLEGKYAKATIKNYSSSIQEAKMAIGGFISNSKVTELKSFSETFAGLKLPPITIIMDSIEITFGADGTTTTISYSNKSFLPPDDAVYIQERVAKINYYNSKRMSAGYKNFLKLH